MEENPCYQQIIWIFSLQAFGENMINTTANITSYP